MPAGAIGTCRGPIEDLVGEAPRSRSPRRRRSPGRRRSRRADEERDAVAGRERPRAGTSRRCRRCRRSPRPGRPPTRIASTSPRRISEPARDVGDERCAGRRPAASSQAVEPAALEDGRRLVDRRPGSRGSRVVGGLGRSPSAVPNWPPASGPPGCSGPGCRSGPSSSARGSAASTRRRPRRARRGRSIASATIASASARIAAGDRVAVLATARRPPSYAAITRSTAQPTVDRRRARRCAARWRGAAEGRPAGVRLRRRGRVRRSAPSRSRPPGPIAGPPRTTRPRIAPGRPRRRSRTSSSTSCAGQRRWSIRRGSSRRSTRNGGPEDRRPVRPRAAAAPAARRRRRGRRAASGRGSRRRASADVRWSAWAAPDDGRRGLDQSPANWRKNRRRPRSAPPSGGGSRLGVAAPSARGRARPGRRSARAASVGGRIGQCRRSGDRVARRLGRLSTG